MDIRLAEVQERVQDRRIQLEADDRAKEWLANAGYDPAYGARPLNRVIQKDLLNRLARMLLEGSVHEDQRVLVSTETVNGAESLLIKPM